jgi:DNA-binding GntR family transcriptional regulator
VAIEQLANEGLLVRQPNRRTRVAGDKISRSAEFMSFSEEMRRVVGAPILRFAR